MTLAIYGFILTSYATEFYSRTKCTAIHVGKQKEDKKLVEFLVSLILIESHLEDTT